jgi:hypothetical protein
VQCSSLPVCTSLPSPSASTCPSPSPVYQVGGAALPGGQPGWVPQAADQGTQRCGGIPGRRCMQGGRSCEGQQGSRAGGQQEVVCVCVAEGRAAGQQGSRGRWRRWCVCGVVVVGWWGVHTRIHAQRWNGRGATRHSTSQHATSRHATSQDGGRTVEVIRCNVSTSSSLVYNLAQVQAAYQHLRAGVCAPPRCWQPARMCP